MTSCRRQRVLGRCSVRAYCRPGRRARLLIVPLIVQTVPARDDLEGGFRSFCDSGRCRLRGDRRFGNDSQGRRVTRNDADPIGHFAAILIPVMSGRSGETVCGRLPARCRDRCPVCRGTRFIIPLVGQSVSFRFYGKACRIPGNDCQILRMLRNRDHDIAAVRGPLRIQQRFIAVGNIDGRPFLIGAGVNYFLQRTAAVKAIISHILQGYRERDLLKRRTAAEGFSAQRNKSF